jgi:Rha family phage regulatory protein
MASNEVSVLTSNGKVVVLSTDIALRFQKKHKEILRDIDRIRAICPKSFYERNFAPVKYTDPKGEERPCFELTRDAFSLLAMGFTGKAAILWKLKYIEAFNALEQAALDALRGQIATTRQQALAEGAKAAFRLGPARRRRMRRAVAYRNKGLSVHDVAKLLNCHGREAGSLLRAAALLGMEA